jgi:hypothetical protein
MVEPLSGIRQRLRERGYPEREDGHPLYEIVPAPTAQPTYIINFYNLTPKPRTIAGVYDAVIAAIGKLPPRGSAGWQ